MTGRLALAVCVASVAFTGSAAAAKEPLPGIRTPSGNISCFVVPGASPLLLCAIERSSYGAALQGRCMRPDGSGVDWHGFELRPTRPGAINCTGGILYDNGRFSPRYRTLAYGSVWHQETFTCTSRRIGLSCRNPGGHGVFVARETWRTW